MMLLIMLTCLLIIVFFLLSPFLREVLTHRLHLLITLLPMNVKTRSLLELQKLTYPIIIPFFVQLMFLLEIEPHITKLKSQYFKEISLTLIAIYFVITCMNRFVSFF